RSAQARRTITKRKPKRFPVMDPSRGRPATMADPRAEARAPRRVRASPSAATAPENSLSLVVAAQLGFGSHGPDDVGQHDHGAVDLVVRRAIRRDAHGEPRAVGGLRLALAWLHRLDDLGDHLLEILDLHRWPQVADRPPDVSGQQAHDLARRLGEAADA